MHHLLALSLFPTRASKPTRLSSGTIFALFVSRPLSSMAINERACLSSLIHCHWLALPPFIVSMNRFLNFPSLRNELSSYSIPKQDSTSELVIIIVSQQVTSSPLPWSSNRTQTFGIGAGASLA
ncbi:hypothetical protein Acr_00g0104610 [Actinidia rufa]|uniref:Uncharacterized protein n=1 Tax=Actinidia rufa TaxID=165716 RepID=A0A7J0D767_9ERIC|nr:hypothetical protein Acr_00g0003660 [Actinidia rufa]GFS28762.1 hypothetical protein Acr_00g0003750 [Actinidia rufa]GFS46923.1 hypothetical protein Acr_00g0104610 [Actinidia rufa]